jgi:4-hydroxy-tetrahydrodipicolinate reductase
MNKPVRVLLVGSAGRMGQAILEAAKEDATTDIVGLCDKGDPIEPAITHSDVVIDFSHVEAVDDICRAVCARKKALVVGTTGHSPEQRQSIERCAESVPVVFSSNFSVGVNALFWLIRKAADMLGPDFDLEIVEMHHRMKKDAPSGTAVTLAEILKSQRKIESTRYGREGHVGERKANEIGIHSIRGGDVVGDHTVIFAQAGERLELTHRATSRTTFAKGALRAAHWIVGRSPGLYSMEDVLGLPGAK